MANESILSTVKKCVGIEEDYTAFDIDIITCINAAFSILHQLGNPPFSISDKSATWGDYVTDESVVNAVKQYIILKTRVNFDPPANSSVLESMKNQIQELEWRINVAVD